MPNFRVLYSRLRHWFARLLPARSAEPRNVNSQRWVRWTRRSLYALAALFALYCVAANSFLRFGLLQRVLATTDSAKVQYASAWSWWPGKVHLTALRVLIQDSNIQASIELERATVDLSLTALLKRTLHFTSVRGDGLAFRFRHRVQPTTAHEPSVLALPPIAGFTDPPVFDATVPEPPASDADYKLWTVHLDNVDVQLSEVWLQQFQYLGSGRASGAFQLMPAKRLWVGPAVLELTGGELHARQQPFANQVQGRMTCTVEPFEVPQVQGVEPLAFVTTHFQLRGQLLSAHFAELFAHSAQPLDLSQARGQFEFDLALERGVLTPTSRVALRGAHFAPRWGNTQIELKDWAIEAAAHEPGAQATFTVEHGSIASHADHSPAAFTQARWQVLFPVRDTTLLPWPIVRQEWSLQRLNAPDLAALGAWGAIAFVAGSAQASGHLVRASDVIWGEGELNLQKAQLRVNDVELRGSAALRATLNDFSQGSGKVKATLRADNVRVHHQSGSPDCPLAKLEALDAHADLTLQDERVVEGLGALELRAGQLRWGDVLAQGAARATLRLNPSKGPSTPGTLALDVTGKELSVSQGAPRRWHAVVPNLQVQASLQKAQRWSGPVTLSMPKVRAQVGRVSLITDVTAALAVQNADDTRWRALVNGKVSLDQAQLWHKRRRVNSWWARLDVTDFLVQLERDVKLDGKLQARFANGLPLLLPLAEQGSAPAWLPQVLPLHGLSGELHVRRQCRLLDVYAPHVTGGPLAGRGRLQNVPGETRGAAVLHLDGLSLASAGVSMSAETDVALLVDDAWLGKQLQGFNEEAGRAWATPCPEDEEESSCANN